MQSEGKGREGKVFGYLFFGLCVCVLVVCLCLCVLVGWLVGRSDDFCVWLLVCFGLSAWLLAWLFLINYVAVVCEKRELVWCVGWLVGLIA